MTLETAYRLFRDRVLIWARRAGVPEADAEDVAHEVFRIFAGHSAAIADAAVSTWLYRTTKHRAMHHARTLATRERGEHREHGSEETPEPSQEHALGGCEVEAVILELVAGLAPDRREAFVRHVIGEEPMEQIAQELGVPLCSMWTRLRLARRDLREALERRRADERRRARGETSFTLSPLLFFSQLWKRRSARIIAPMTCAAGVFVSLALPLAGRDAEKLGPTAEEPIAGRAIEVAPLLPLVFVEAPREHAAAGAVPPAGAPAVEHAAVAGELLLERQLVALAHRALTDGSSTRARGYLDRADRAYPRGALLPERAQLRARAAP